MRLIHTLFFVLIYTVSGYCQVEISEYSASNMNTFPDSFGKFEDYIELHNTGTATIDLSGYGLSDKESKPRKWIFPQGSIIGPDEYLVVWCSGRDVSVDGEFHTNFKLTQTKGNEYILLSDSNGDIIESSLYELTLLANARVKVDGRWRIAEEMSPGIENPSSVKNAYTAQPTLDLEAGFYADMVTVSIASTEPNAVIRVSLDGKIPTQSNAIYAGPINISNTTVVKARVFSNDPSVLPGKIAYATYFINESSTLPVFSIAADELQELAGGDRELRPIGSIEYFIDGKLSSTSYGELNSHGQDSWINPQRSIDWVSRDEMGYYKTFEEKLFDYSDRTDYQRFMLRASGDDNYPAFDDEDHEGSTHMRDEYVHTLAQEGGMKLDVRAIARSIVFLNGDYWGIYSPRERPVDHDYTAEYYDQEKLDLQYITTWGSTWPEYGGEQAMLDWKAFSTDLLSRDMSKAENYQFVKDNMQVLGLIDYMIINLTSVCSDWINYNTGWWRGLNPEGDHKKWGYILWDNDATFDFYINYSGVPNTTPSAKPCDIEGIASAVDQFFIQQANEGGVDTSMADQCLTILNGTCPYPSTDSIFLLTISLDGYCCNADWDQTCQGIYNDIAAGISNPADCNSILNGSSPYPADDVIFQSVINQEPACCNGDWTIDCQDLYNFIVDNQPEPFSVLYNFGQHEKIFLKLIEESPEFRQLYYSRQADMMNTAFSCENMLGTLDRMVDEIAPEMPRHAARWNGSVDEWEKNISDLRSYIEERCTLLDDGMLDCYEVEGPYELTLESFPAEGGHIDLNTLDVKDLPWTGQYFGNMENLIDADPSDGFKFVRWESKSGSTIFPDSNSEEARITLTKADTLVAVFRSETVSTTPIKKESIDLSIYPSPASDFIHVQYTLDKSTGVQISIHNLLGKVMYNHGKQNHIAGNKINERLDIKELALAPGTYFVNLKTDFGSVQQKIIVL